MAKCSNFGVKFIARFFAALVLLVSHVSVEMAFGQVQIASKAYVDEIVSAIEVAQSDWNQTDSRAADYIQNKPDIYTKAEVDVALDTKADSDDIRFSTVPSTEPSGTPPSGQVFIWFN